MYILIQIFVWNVSITLCMHKQILETFQTHGGDRW